MTLQEAIAFMARYHELQGATSTKHDMARNKVLDAARREAYRTDSD